jgi:hypothetical protein
VTSAFGTTRNCPGTHGISGTEGRPAHPQPGDDSFLLAALGICHSRWLPTQRRRRSDPNGTSPTRSQQSEGASSSRSPRPCRDALAAIRRSGRRPEFLITDAVRLGLCGDRGGNDAVHCRNSVTACGYAAGSGAVTSRTSRKVGTTGCPARSTRRGIQRRLATRISPWPSRIAQSSMRSSSTVISARDPIAGSRSPGPDSKGPDLRLLAEHSGRI